MMTILQRLPGIVTSTGITGGADIHPYSDATPFSLKKPHLTKIKSYVDMQHESTHEPMSEEAISSTHRHYCSHQPDHLAGWTMNSTLEGRPKIQPHHRNNSWRFQAWRPSHHPTISCTYNSTRCVLWCSDYINWPQNKSNWMFNHHCNLLLTKSQWIHQTSICHMEWRKSTS